HQGGIDCPWSARHACHHLFRIPELRYRLGMHKRSDFKTWNPNRTQPIHGLYFHLCRDELWLYLKAIARPNLTNGDNVGWHQLSFRKTTCSSRIVAYFSVAPASSVPMAARLWLP